MRAGRPPYLPPSSCVQAALPIYRHIYRPPFVCRPPSLSTAICLRSIGGGSVRWAECVCVGVWEGGLTQGQPGLGVGRRACRKGGAEGVTLGGAEGVTLGHAMARCTPH